MGLVNKDMDVAGSDFAQQISKPSFRKIIPIMNFQKDGVANGHHTPSIRARRFRRYGASG
jgi:hypothetical protein